MEMKRHKDSSAFVFDLRNSTAITRQLSSTSTDRLNSFLEFMQRLASLVYELSYEKIGKEPSSAINHTGDGFLCVYWDKVHAITALRIALEIRLFLNKEIPKLIQHLHTSDDLTIDFGIALHTGSSSVYLFKPPLLKLIYGTLPNTVSRLEKQTKIRRRRIILTGNFRKYLLRHLKKLDVQKLSDDQLGLKRLSSGGRVNIDDGKLSGHFLYCILETEADRVHSVLTQNR